MTESLAAQSATMMDELETDPIFLPSAFWRTVNAKNIAMLEADGIENFKRTVSQNYYNWLITKPLNPQFRTALAAWLHTRSGAPFATKIEAPLAIRLITSDKPLVLTAWQRFVYKTFVGLVWERMRSLDAHNLAARVSEPSVGNPIRIEEGGRLISQDLANSILECNVVADLVAGLPHRPRVAEIGAGYGRVAHVYAATQPGTYFIFDIPPALQVSQYYLSTVFPDKRIFRFRRWENFADVEAEIEASDIVFMSANQIRRFPPGYFDVMLSISTLPEMSGEQVALYLAEFDRLTRGQVFLKQWKSWRNRLDNIHMRAADYRPGPDWKLALDRTDPINPEFFNQVWTRG